MGGLSSLSIASSGMWAAQGALSVVGHNLANVDTIGYSRQSVLQSDWSYLNTSAGQIGYGTTISSVRQIRNEFLDIQYRSEVTKATYYTAKVDAGQQIETLLGELQSEYTTESVITDLWDSLNELSSDPSALENRGNFISSAITLVDKMGVVYDGLIEYQNNLNESVKDMVDELNYYVEEIDRLSNLIKSSEATGANANDYRDARNNCMDALAEICDVDYRQKVDGSIDITLEGYPLLSNGMINEVGLKYTTADCSFVEPVFTSSDKILPYDSKAKTLYDLTDSIDTAKGEDGGLLKGTLVARGLCPVDYTTLESLVSSDDFLRAGAPDPADYDGVDDPAYQAAVSAFTAGTNFLDSLVSELGFLPSAPVAPNPSDYTGGTDSVSYQADLITYYAEIESFNATRTFDAPVAPDPSDYIDSAEYQADYDAYLSEVTTYNDNMQSLTMPTDTSSPTYNLEMAQYQEDMIAYNNYLDKYTEYSENPTLYDYNYDRMLFNCTESTVPVLMQNLDQIFHDIVTMINDAVAPVDHNSDTAPAGVDEDNTQFMEIFVRKSSDYEDRYDADGNYLVEDLSNKSSLYSIRNVEINPELLDPSGYNKIGFSSIDNPSDNTVVNGLIDEWDSATCKLPDGPDEEYEALSIDEAYNLMVTLNATATAEDNTFLEAQIVMVNSVENSRLAVMGVSLDEEMANMTIYQNAYEASARVFTVIDEMLDRLINGTGRVGL